MKKIILSLFVLLIISIGLVQMFPALFLKPTFLLQTPQSRYPLVYTKPVSRTIPSTSTNSSSLTFHTLYFKTPFSTITLDKTSSDGKMRSITSADSKNILLIEDTASDIKKSALESNDPEKRAAFKEYFDTLGDHPQYALFQRIVNTTPSDLHLFAGKKDSIITSILLYYKTSTIPNTQSNTLYIFTTPTIDGFQAGKAGVDNVYTKVFTNSDKVYTIAFSKNMTQEEIDMVLGSLQ